MFLSMDSHIVCSSCVADTTLETMFLNLAVPYIYEWERGTLQLLSIGHYPHTRNKDTGLDENGPLY